MEDVEKMNDVSPDATVKVISRDQSGKVNYTFEAFAKDLLNSSSSLVEMDSDGKIVLVPNCVSSVGRTVEIVANVYYKGTYSMVDEDHLKDVEQWVIDTAKPPKDVIRCTVGDIIKPEVNKYFDPRNFKSVKYVSADTSYIRNKRGTDGFLAVRKGTSAINCEVELVTGAKATITMKVIIAGEY